MSDTSSVDVILSQAGEREKQYDWLGTVELYSKALDLLPETDFSKKGQIQERIGYALYRTAMQAESQEEFRERMRLAVASYEKAKEFYGRLSEPRKTPRILRCDSMIAYLGYWLTSEVAEKKRLLEECWRLVREALKAFGEVEDASGYGKTYNQLSSTPHLFYNLEWNFQAREKIIREAIECGERAITLLSEVGDAYELTKAYAKEAIFLNTLGYNFFPDMDEKDKCLQKSLGYWKKASELSEEVALLEMLSSSGESLAWNINETLENYERALGWAKKSKDKYLMGMALDWLAYTTFWKAAVTDEPDKKLETYQRSLEFARDAKHQFSSISFLSPRGGTLWIEAPLAEYNWELAFWETDSRKRRDLLDEAVNDGTRAIKLAESTGYPEIVGYMNHVLSKAMVSLAQTETSIEERRKLLEKALEHRNESIGIMEQLRPLDYWSLGVMWVYLAHLKAELSGIENDLNKKKNMLEEAISNVERGLQLCVKANLYFEKIGDLTYLTAIGYYQYPYGDLLNRLYALTSNKEHQIRAIKTFEKAAESFQKLNLFSRIAECYWKAARGYNALLEHLKAAENFNLASNSYTSAAEKIPQLTDFYQDHALYMQAWSEIEKARHHHAKQEYGTAKEHYEKATTTHKTLKQWSYLAPNYSAWTQVENAEDLSRRENSEEAIQAFEEAAKLFTETKKSLETKLREIENLDEKTMATNLIKASDLRREYCVGRIALEEAKILDKKGDHYSSSQKYGEAAQTFEKIAQELEPEQDRKELKLILTLSQAWQKMTQAEAEASPTLYMEASQLFEEAKEFSPSEKAKMLALGHSRFCRALEAGTKFADTGDPSMHTAAVQSLESAAKYYMNAGFHKASEYAKATRLLFDAYVYMDDAKKEKDPEKKAKLYAMAEKVLQTSAGSFMKAEHPEKREQVLRLLEEVKQERELAVSLTEVMHAPTIVSATASFPSPAPTHEEAVGLEKFEHADIQANIITRRKELKVGENLDLELELVNAGRGPALLIKVTEVIPEGFDIVHKPENYRVEDSFLNMKGRRLDPLKTEEVKLVLKPKMQGTFPLKPRVHYLDENGKYKSHEPEPVTITVKELGIKGWVKGER